MIEGFRNRGPKDLVHLRRDLARHSNLTRYDIPHDTPRGSKTWVFHAALSICRRSRYRQDRLQAGRGRLTITGAMPSRHPYTDVLFRRVGSTIGLGGLLQ